MEKNLELFQICFTKAFNITGLADNFMLTYEDLRQECYIVFDRAKECTNEKTYATYITGRLIGAIRQYRRKILKTRKWIDGRFESINNLPNNTHNISLDLYEGETRELQSTEMADYLGADIIVEAVLSNGLFNENEKTYFSLSFIENMKDVEIAERRMVSQGRISQIKKSVYTKLRARYT